MEKSPHEGDHKGDINTKGAEKTAPATHVALVVYGFIDFFQVVMIDLAFLPEDFP